MISSLKECLEVSHSDTLVELGVPLERTEQPAGLDKKEWQKYVMVPMNVRAARIRVEERTEKLEAYADEFKYNKMEFNDTKIGFIASGVTYNYTKDIFPEWSSLKLGMVWPLPKKMIAEFFNKVEKVVIVEELDPFFETEIRAMGYKPFHGKDVIPTMYELTPDIIEKSLKSNEYKAPEIRVKPEDLPRRPPNLCVGCSHRPLFYALNKLGAFVFGDIGCYTLAAAPPLSAIHTTVCMGAGVAQAHGAMKAIGKEALGKVCSVLGDSTFLHNGLTPLMDIVYNKGNATTIVVDNRITGMTGHQEHPGTGFTIRGEPTNMVDYEEIGRALGVQSIRKVDPYKIDETMELLKEEMDKDEPSLVLCVDAPCMLLRREKRQFEHSLYAIDADKCRGCKICLNINCPAISWRENAGETVDGHKRKGIVHINPDQCVGCQVCQQLCKFEAITRYIIRRKTMKENGKVTNIFLSGVGGQGAILASNILGEAFLNAGYDVKKAEVHGMAQRGGDVTTHFRWGKKVYSPLIKQGDVDFLISFELLEAIRYINWVKPESKIIINNQTVFPPAVNLGLMEYPKDVDETFKKYFKDNVHIIDGQDIARNLGNLQAANVVIVGAFSSFFPELKEELFVDAIKSLLAPKLHDLNVKAFYEGKKAMEQKV